MHHRGTRQRAKACQNMCADPTINFGVKPIEKLCVANLPSQYKCNQQRSICQNGERKKDSFHDKVSVPEERPAGSMATGLFKE